jgi:hypothetical protein
MNKVKVFYKYGADIDIDTEKNVNVYIDEFNTTPVTDDELRIVITDEPLKSTLYHLMETYTNCYTYILTYHESILANNSKARLFHSGGAVPWMHDYVSPNKVFRISALVGGKNEPRMEGYKLRHDLWRGQWKIDVPKDFYLSSQSRWNEVDYRGQKVLGDSKYPLFDSMFHIAIENTSIKDYFSEKILDCFQSRTVPIYAGCRNIGDYFNMDGIIVVSNLDEIVDVCNKLTPYDYERRKPAMEDNFNRSCVWGRYDARVKAKIIELIQ